MIKFPVDLGRWTLGDLRNRVRKDPVNVLLAKRTALEAATFLRALRIGGFQFGPIGLGDRLANPIVSTDQWFSHRVTGIHRNDVALGSGRKIVPLGNRLHIRIYDPFDNHPDLKRYSAAAIHQDAFGIAAPPDIATTFVGAREALVDALRSRPGRRPELQVELVRTRDRRSSTQANGSVVRTDGYIVVIL